MSKAGREIYDHPAWKTVRAEVLERDGWRCQIASRRCLGTATEVDHIVAIVDGGHPYDPTNLRAACRPCNAGRRQRERRQWKRDDPPPSRNW